MLTQVSGLAGIAVSAAKLLGRHHDKWSNQDSSKDADGLCQSDGVAVWTVRGLMLGGGSDTGLAGRSVEGCSAARCATDAR